MPVLETSMRFSTATTLLLIFAAGYTASVTMLVLAISA